MTPGFAPLTAPAAAGAAPAPAAAKTFRPLAEGLKAPCPAAAPAALAEPKVTLQREGDRITTITIQCVCGHTIELACG